ncbi:hypothetical protein [Arthrobacter sp. efr-133-R2A-63]|uniref:hypothetical protein n=1 Tax=Arthrobacter sp. efr-133-R2A-63 TaxID=3040278 RepID=UPI002549C7A0|nr:hypothetical protein [Arthrobacter sp. efr-133-R2A-63]
MGTGSPSGLASLSLRQAARRAGRDVMAFKSVADGLNGTAADLRIPGNRGTPRYDPERLEHWLREHQGPDGGHGQGPLVTVPIDASWDGIRWSRTSPKSWACHTSASRRL